MNTEFVYEITIALIGSSVLGGLVGAIFNGKRNKYDKMIENVTNQRGCWREKIKDIAAEIEKCDFSTNNMKRMSNLLQQLQMSINSNGYLKRNIYEMDGHIWDEIEAIQLAKNKEEFIKRKRILLLELSFLLKDDWERSKKEIKGKYFNAWNIVIMLFMVIIHALFSFLVCGERNIYIFVVECILISIYSFLVPCTFVELAFERSRYGKEEKITKILNKQKRDTIYRWGMPILGTLLLIIMYGVVSCLATVSVLENYTYSDNGEVVITERNSPLEKSIYEEFNKSKEEITIEGNKEVYNSRLENLYIKVAYKEVWNKFGGFVLLYFLLTFFYIFHTISTKFGQGEYRDRIQQLILKENHFYIDEINELITKLIESYEAQKYDAEYEMILRIVYIKLEELSRYMVKSNYSRKQRIETYSDIEKEIRYDELSNNLKSLLKKMGKNCSNLLSKKKRTSDTDKFITELRNLNLNRLI